MTVFPSSSQNFRIVRKHFVWKERSPTARISSIKRTSNGTITAMAKPRRMFIPEE